MTVVRSVVFSKEKLAMKAVLFIGLVVLLEYGICLPFVWTNFSDSWTVPARALLSGSEKEGVKLQRQWKLRYETVLTPSKKPSPRGTGQPTPQSFIRVNSFPRSNPYPFIYHFWQIRILRWPTTVTAKPKTSRQNQNTSLQNRKPHLKTENLTAKPKSSRQNQRPHGKNNMQCFTAKTKYLTAKANTQGKTKAILLLLWSIWFCRTVFCFCREVFCFCCEVSGFAVMFLVLPWGFWFCRESCVPP